MKALYGHPGSPLWWFELAIKILAEIGFKPISTELCIFRKENGTLLILYVDDMIIAATAIEELDHIAAEIANKFEIKVMGEVEVFLGLEIKRDRKNRVILINQAKYITKVLEKFAPDIKNASTTPWPPKKQEVVMSSKEWLKRTGSLNYISVGTRPDITYTVQKLCEANSGPTNTHEEVLKHLFAYLYGTETLSIRLGGYYEGKDLNPRVYADASFADELAEILNRRPHRIRR